MVNVLQLILGHGMTLKVQDGRQKWALDHSFQLYTMGDFCLKITFGSCLYDT